ncbi:MAG TPA: cation-translocating P-type ATPase [Candidatus Bathyarchaeia archaeon]|nr:cation-translocating P-type ATPase [Candidatus Bathyarchaeia archaeon]
MNLEPETLSAPQRDEHSSAESEQEEHSVIERADILRIALVVAAAVFVWLVPRWGWVGTAGVLVGGFPIFAEAYENLRERRMTMELSMTLALVAALVIREFFTALIITLFVLVAEILEGLTVSRGRQAIADLLQFLPSTALLLLNGEFVECPIAAVRAGDRVLIRPGSRIPVDGKVVAGASNVEEAAITGEPMPQEKLPGALVYAGTLNQTGALEVEVERVGKETTYGRIVEAVEKAERTRAPIQKTADRLAGYLVYFALGAALLTFLITHNARSTISVIIVAGACGIAAGTPLAILGAVGRAARQGAVIKGGLYLELLACIDTVLLDKTGTLTIGVPSVQQVIPTAGRSAEEVLQVAASIEMLSEHPLAAAVVQCAKAHKLEPRQASGFHYSVGRGVAAVIEGKTVRVGNAAFLVEHGIAAPEETATAGTLLFVAADREFLGSLVVADSLRPEAIQAADDLRRMGLSLELLTGDTQQAANELGKQAAFARVSGQMLPEDKLRRVEELVAANKTVAMIGDGINDAPALARAQVGVAMGSGTAVARESADVVLIGNDLNRFVETVRIARRCLSIIYQNFYGTLAVDAAGMALAAVGVLSPLLAAFIHVSSELTFILNSTRMLANKRTDVAAEAVTLHTPMLGVPECAGFPMESSSRSKSTGFW